MMVASWVTDGWIVSDLLALPHDYPTTPALRMIFGMVFVCLCLFIGMFFSKEIHYRSVKRRLEIAESLERDSLKMLIVIKSLLEQALQARKTTAETVEKVKEEVKEGTQKVANTVVEKAEEIKQTVMDSVVVKNWKESVTTEPPCPPSASDTRSSG